LECVRATLRIEQGGIPGQGQVGDPAVIHGTLHVTAYVECIEPVRFPEHKWRLSVEAGGTQLAMTPRIRGPVVPASGGGHSPVSGPRFEPIGSISYVPTSGLHVNGSDTIEISASAQWPDPDGTLAEGVRRAQKPMAEIRLPLALSERIASLEVALRRARRLPMVNDLSLPHEDLRLGEFTVGTGFSWTWLRYEGHHIPRPPSATP